MPRWSFAARKAISASPVVAGEMLYVASYDQTLTALAARDGTLHWQFTAGGPIHATPVVGDGHVYVAAMDGVVYALQ
jgi:outer membrane protein assembly factor BamB